MDRLGRVSFYTVFLAVNHLNVTRHQILDQDDDLSALVGFWWLPVERAVRSLWVWRDGWEDVWEGVCKEGNGREC